MARLTEGSSFRNSRVLLFHHSVVFLLLMQLTAGQSTENNHCQSILATIGQDTILPCQLESATNISSMTLEWTRADPSPRFVHVWRDGEDALARQNKAYKGRTSLNIENLKHGDISLKISNLGLSDNGTYRCYVPDLDKESFTCLIVSGEAPVSMHVWKIVVIVIGLILGTLISVVTGRKVDCESLETMLG